MSASFVQQIQLALPGFEVMDLSPMIEVFLPKVLALLAREKRVVGVLANHPANNDIITMLSSKNPHWDNVRFLVFHNGDVKKYSNEDMETIQKIKRSVNPE